MGPAHDTSKLCNKNDNDCGLDTFHIQLFVAYDHKRKPGSRRARKKSKKKSNVWSNYNRNKNNEKYFDCDLFNGVLPPTNLHECNLKSSENEHQLGKVKFTSPNLL